MSEEIVEVKVGLPRSLIRKIEELQDALHLSSKGEVISYAVTLLGTINDSRKEVSKIVIPMDKYPASGSGRSKKLELDW